MPTPWWSPWGSCRRGANCTTWTRRLRQALGTSGCASLYREGSYAHYYLLVLHEPGEVELGLQSDTANHIALRSADGAELAHDAGSVVRDAQLTRTLEAGTYVIETLSHEVGQAVDYTLTVSAQAVVLAWSESELEPLLPLTLEVVEVTAKRAVLRWGPMPVRVEPEPVETFLACHFASDGPKYKHMVASDFFAPGIDQYVMTGSIGPNGENECTIRFRTYRNYLNATPLSTNAVRFRYQDEPQGTPSEPPSQSLSGEPVAAPARGVKLRWTPPVGWELKAISIARRDVTRGEELLQRHAQLTDLGATEYTDLAVAAGHEYEYLVIFDVNERYDGRWATLTTNVIRVDLASLLQRPTNLRGEDVTYNALMLRWDAPADVDGVEVVGYQIYRRDPGDGELSLLVEDTDSADTEYRDYVLAGESAYGYRVRAIVEVAGAGSEPRRQLGPPSGEASFTTEVTVVAWCPEGGDTSGPTGVAVAVMSAPIVVESTTEEYFVLYVLFDGKAMPVLVKRGEAGATTLAENVAALPADRYQVEKYLVDDPADVDGDCIDDITELANLGRLNPVNPAKPMTERDGVAAIPDREAYDALVAQRRQNNPVKFILMDMDTDRPSIYFMNWRYHSLFIHFVLVPTFGYNNAWNQAIRGDIVYDPNLVAPDGSAGAYYSSLNMAFSHYSFNFSLVERAYALIAASMPLLDDDLIVYVYTGQVPKSQAELQSYRNSRITLLGPEGIFNETRFLDLNPGEGYGRLRVMEPDERPHPHDIVIYETLPNNLPRVAGIISTVPQTPLSHVNLRAIQDGIPNAFVRGALDNDNIKGLLGSYVHYSVTADGYTVRAATKAEVEAHYESSRPAEAQTPQRDLSITSITALSDIGFADWDAFGVKAANLAELRTLDLPAGTIPDGFAIPFYFYDEFMKANGLYDDVAEMLADAEFQTDYDEQAKRLKKLRKKIKKADTPQWITDALTTMHATYPEGQSLRYRSSTNNEDLPGFNGAGLYDSKTQHPDETEEDGIAKSLKQVYASLWNFRAFTEREFYRIDHSAAAMGVLVHPNYSDELANGVAVTFDPVFGTDGSYYVNTQVGEDLVTNPEAHSMPEEILLGPEDGDYQIIATSNLVEPGQLLLSDDQLSQLQDNLTAIKEHFENLYKPADGEPFAIEIEFKITIDNVLAIKQARPWIF